MNTQSRKFLGKLCIKTLQTRTKVAKEYPQAWKVTAGVKMPSAAEIFNGRQ